MDFNNLLAKIKEEINDDNTSNNYAKALYNSPSDFNLIVEQWVNGYEEDYTFQNISLVDIRNKEKCSYLKALLRMQILISNPSLIKGYSKWTPIQKDWGR